MPPPTKVDKPPDLQLVQKEMEPHSHPQVSLKTGETSMIPHTEAPAGHQDGAIFLVMDDVTFQLIPAEEFDQAKGPLATLARFINRVLAKTDFFRPVKSPMGDQLPSPTGSRGVQKIDPERIRQAISQARGEGLLKDFTRFDDVVVARFVEGKQVWVLLKPGESHYRPKVQQEVFQFFQKGWPFTQRKEGQVRDLERAIYRGLVRMPTEVTFREGKLKATQEMMMLISDLQFRAGRIEKFVRIPISLSNTSQVLSHLSSLTPGTSLSQQLLAQWFGDGAFSYLALSHKVVRPDLSRAFASALTESAAARVGGIAYAQEPTKGIALQARTEELVARQLDMVRPVVQPVGREAQGLRDASSVPHVEGSGGIFQFLWRRRRTDEEPILIPGFVPWYRLIFYPRKWRGKIRWWVPLLYFVIFSSAALFLIYVFKFLLQR